MGRFRNCEDIMRIFFASCSGLSCLCKDLHYQFWFASLQGSHEKRAGTPGERVRSYWLLILRGMSRSSKASQEFWSDRTPWVVEGTFNMRIILLLKCPSFIRFMSRFLRECLIGLDCIKMVQMNRVYCIEDIRSSSLKILISHLKFSTLQWKLLAPAKSVRIFRFPMMEYTIFGIKILFIMLKVCILVIYIKYLIPFCTRFQFKNQKIVAIPTDIWTQCFI